MRCGFNILHMFKTICLCSSTRYGKAVNLGKRSILRTLNLFNFLKRQRENLAAIWALTNFEHRRLLKQQVKAGLLLPELEGGEDWYQSKSNQAKEKNDNDEEGYGTKKKGSSMTREERRAHELIRTTDRLWDSSDEYSSSEEDFAFLDAYKTGKKPMTEVEAKLIQGIIHMPLKDKKRFDRKRMEADRLN